MGWKITSIIIKNPVSISDKKILDSLFDANYETLDSMSFEDCIYPSEDETLYFGNYKNNLIISTDAFGLVNKFFTKDISKAEEIFIGIFPNSEIGAFSLQSSMNYYAWTIISKGQKIRAKQGDGDNGIMCDYGDPLPEEEEFIKLSFRDKKGDLKYNWPKKNGEFREYTEDQIGENYVSKIWSRFTGIELFNDTLLNEVQFRGYKLRPKTTELDPEENDRNFWQRLFGRKKNN